CCGFDFEAGIAFPDRSPLTVAPRPNERARNGKNNAGATVPLLAKLHGVTPLAGQLNQPRGLEGRQYAVWQDAVLPLECHERIVGVAAELAVRETCVEPGQDQVGLDSAPFPVGQTVEPLPGPVVVCISAR